MERPTVSWNFIIFAPHGGCLGELPMAGLHFPACGELSIILLLYWSFIGVLAKIVNNCPISGSEWPVGVKGMQGTRKVKQ